MFNQRAVRAEAFARLARLPSSSSSISLQNEESDRFSKSSRRSEGHHASVLLNGSAHGSRASTNGLGSMVRAEIESPYCPVVSLIGVDIDTTTV